MYSLKNWLHDGNNLLDLLESRSKDCGETPQAAVFT